MERRGSGLAVLVFGWDADDGEIAYGRSMFGIVLTDLQLEDDTSSMRSESPTSCDTNENASAASILGIIPLQAAQWCALVSAARPALPTSSAAHQAATTAYCFISSPRETRPLHRRRHIWHPPATQRNSPDAADQRQTGPGPAAAHH